MKLDICTCIYMASVRTAEGMQHMVGFAEAGERGYPDSMGSSSTLSASISMSVRLEILGHNEEFATAFSANASGSFEAHLEDAEPIASGF